MWFYYVLLFWDNRANFSHVRGCGAPTGHQPQPVSSLAFNPEVELRSTGEMMIFQYLSHIWNHLQKSYHGSSMFELSTSMAPDIHRLLPRSAARLCSKIPNSGDFCETEKHVWLSFRKRRSSIFPPMGEMPIRNSSPHIPWLSHQVKPCFSPTTKLCYGVFSPD